MRLQEKFIVISTDSTHFVINLEKILLDKNIKCRVIPLPVEISANCGLAVKLDENDLEEAKKIILENNFLVNVALVEKNGLKKTIQKLEIGGKKVAE
ncbi:DUF3343 domain-containing protein [Fusobacterium sp.]|uniref:DUF3343 domain-containing protein n=1 Tax=Fusobacterium sp. TaxID=68766 RepID=UPI002616C548|nr:DUF3343 domain-containing protein [Fusobacterium sp.]